MARKITRKALSDKLDKVSKQIVKLRDGNVCQHCGKWVEGRDRQASHVIPVSAGSKLRWDPMNMKVLCNYCHLHWWHKNPMEAAQWFEEKFPDRWEYLQANRGIAKFTVPQLEDKLGELQDALNKLEHLDKA